MVATAAVVLLLLAPGGEPQLLKVPASIRRTQEHYQAIYELVSPSVVYIAAGGRSGSGFFVAEGLVLTNSHVVGRNSAVDVILKSGQSTRGKVVQLASGDVDLVLLRVPLSAPALPIVGGFAPSPGTLVASVGHGGGAVWTFNLGSVSNAYYQTGRMRVIQTQIPLNPGNSGGPLVNMQGRVIGVVTAGVESANAVNFAIPTDKAVEVLPALWGHCQCVLIMAPPKSPIFVDGKMVSDAGIYALLPDGANHEVFALIDGRMNRSFYRGVGSAIIDLSE